MTDTAPSASTPPPRDTGPEVAFAALLLADARFPAGGAGHSGGAESAIVDGRVHDVATLGAFVRGRLATVGLTDASMAVATAWQLRRATSDDEREAVLVQADAELDVRQVSPVLRAASRRLGRQLLRAAARCWPGPVIDSLEQAAPAHGGATSGLHQAVALGGVGVAAGLPGDVIGRLVVHHATSTPAQAGVRLLGLDPFAVAAILAGLATEAELVVAGAVAGQATPLAELPARSAPLVEIASVAHGADRARMFTT